MRQVRGGKSAPRILVALGTLGNQTQQYRISCTCPATDQSSDATNYLGRLISRLEQLFSVQCRWDPIGEENRRLYEPVVSSLGSAKASRIGQCRIMWLPVNRMVLSKPQWSALRDFYEAAEHRLVQRSRAARASLLWAGCTLASKNAAVAVVPSSVSPLENWQMLLD